MICYGHFPLWAAINLPHCPFKRSQWRKFSARHRYRQWSLHFNPTWGFIIQNVARVAFRGPEGNQTSSTFSAFFFFLGGGALLNRWFKQHDRWQHTPPLNLTALIKLTVAIKHIPRKYVSNDTWSPAGHLRSKLYSKILLKPTSAGEGAQFGTQGWDLHLCRLFLHGSKSQRLRKQIKSHHDERHVVAKMCLLTLKLSLTRGCLFFFFFVTAIPVAAIDACVFHSAPWRRRMGCKLCP